MKFLTSAARLPLRFMRDEAGLVTVEWVAISAAVVVGGILIAYEVLNGMDPVAAKIGTALTNQVPASVTTPSLGDGS